MTENDPEQQMAATSAVRLDEAQIVAVAAIAQTKKIAALTKEVGIFRWLQASTEQPSGISPLG